MKKIKIKVLCAIVLLGSVVPLHCMTPTLRSKISGLWRRPVTSGMSLKTAALLAKNEQERLSAQSSNALPIRDTSTWSALFQSGKDWFKSLFQRSPVQSQVSQQSSYVSIRNAPFGGRAYSTTPVQRKSWFGDQLQKLINSTQKLINPTQYEEQKRVEERNLVLEKQLSEMGNDIQEYHQISQALKKIAGIEKFEAKNFQERLDRFGDVPTAISYAIMDLYFMALRSAETFADIKTLEKALKLKLRYTPTLFLSGMKPGIDALKKKYNEIYEKLEKNAIASIVMSNEEKLALASMEDETNMDPANMKILRNYEQKVEQKRQEIQQKSKDAGIENLEELIREKIKGQ